MPVVSRSRCTTKDPVGDRGGDRGGDNREESRIETNQNLEWTKRLIPSCVTRDREPRDREPRDREPQRADRARNSHCERFDSRMRLPAEDGTPDTMKHFGSSLLIRDSREPTTLRW